VALYAIGDIHGCYRTFQNLLRRIEFSPDRDRLWLVGDLVNRGPASVEVLRWARRHESSVTCVLGNHDLKLLACAAALRKPAGKDTLEDVLGAPDRDELIEWLAARHFVHRDGPFLMVHAGLLPAWSAEEACRLARELEAALRGPERVETLRAISSKGPLEWAESLRPPDRWRSLAAVFTRLRTCYENGRPAWDYAGPRERIPAGQCAWFDAPGRRSATHTVCFGHWAALGLYLRPGVTALDSGCAWGGRLTALRLPDLTVTQAPLADKPLPEAARRPSSVRQK